MSPSRQKERTFRPTGENQALRALVSNLLASRGYTVLFATSGMDAVRLVAAFKESAGRALSNYEKVQAANIKLAILIHGDWRETRILVKTGTTSGMVILNSGWQFLPELCLVDTLREFLREQLPVEVFAPVNGSAA